MDLPLSVLAHVAGALERLGIQYVLVGSFASSMHGMYRAGEKLGVTELLEKALDEAREEPNV